VNPGQAQWKSERKDTAVQHAKDGFRFLLAFLLGLNASDESIEVINSAAVRDLQTAAAAEYVGVITRESESLGADAHRCRDGRNTWLDIDRDGCVGAGSAIGEDNVVRYGAVS
jgi:hypothetical protein